MKTLLIIAFGLVCSIAAQAAPQPVSAALYRYGARVRAVAATVPHPADWRFLVIPEGQWDHLIDHNGLRDNQPTTAVSNLDTHFTLLRVGYVALASDSEIRRTLAHEMGHRICSCTDENKANYWQDRILKGEIK